MFGLEGPATGLGAKSCRLVTNELFHKVLGLHQGVIQSEFLTRGLGFLGL